MKIQNGKIVGIAHFVIIVTQNVILFQQIGKYRIEIIIAFKKGIIKMKMDNRIEKFYFTFGSSEQFPFKYGYVIVEAEDIKQAIKVFRAYFPDVVEGIINCAFYYTEEQFMKTCMTNDKCHRIIGFKVED